MRLQRRCCLQELKDEAGILVIGNRVYDMAMEILKEDSYAMHESYSNEQIAECVQKIVGRLNRQGGKYSQTITADL